MILRDSKAKLEGPGAGRIRFNDKEGKMAEIRSALEIALDRTDGIKVDKEKIAQDKVQQEARKCASLFLFEKTPPSLEKESAGYDPKEQKWFRRGLFETFCSNLKMPRNEDFQEEAARLEEGFAFLIEDKETLSYLFEQVRAFFGQYFSNRTQLVEQLKAQYEPQFRQKTEKLAQQMGGALDLSVEQDPEFQTMLKNNLSQLEDRYGEAVGQVKEELERLFQK